MNQPSADVTIIGGGIIGTALAWELTARNITVALYDRREIGREATWASAGIISPPGERHGSRSQLALDAFRRYPALIAEAQELSGIAVGYNPTGQLNLGEDLHAEQFASDARWLAEHGIPAEMLDAQAIREREPAVLERYTHGILVRGSGSVLLGQLARALARGAQRRGATIHEHCRVEGVVVERGRATAIRTFDGTWPAGTVVIAAGAWSRMLGDSIDLPAPTYPVRGQMLALADPPVPIRSVLSAGLGYLVPRADGTIAVGATEEHTSGFDDRVTPAGLAELAWIISNLAPSLAQGRFIGAWAGLRPGSDDGELIVGRAPQLENVWLATGHYRSGALLAPATAGLLAESIATGHTAAGLAAFDPARFVR